MDLSAYDEPQPLRCLLQDLLSEEEQRRFNELENAFAAVERGELRLQAIECAEDEWETLLREISERTKAALSLGTLYIRGWSEDPQNREPIELLFAVLSEGYLDVPGSQILVGGKRYVGCTVTRRAPKHTVTAGSTGRPINPKMKAAYDEALPRVQAGEKKDVVALEVAQKHGVNKETLRTYLKPSRAPKSIKP